MSDEDTRPRVIEFGTFEMPHDIQTIRALHAQVSELTAERDALYASRDTQRDRVRVLTAEVDRLRAELASECHAHQDAVAREQEDMDTLRELREAAEAVNLLIARRMHVPHDNEARLFTDDAELHMFGAVLAKTRST